MKNNKPLQPEIKPVKKYLFGMIFFFLIILLLEFLLSFAGLEKFDREFMPKSSYPIFVPGKGDMSDYYVTSTHFGTYINTQSFLRKKPADVTRIFVIGGSAAYGFPYTEEYGFSGYIRRALDKTAPGRFEIINASGMSFGSHRVLDVLKDVVLFEPDIVIIYSGNNEYVEQNVLPETKTPPAVMEKISSLFNQTDIYRAIRLSLFKVTPKVFEGRIKQDLTDIRSNPQVDRGTMGRNTDTDITILANYHNNITAMTKLLVKQDIKVILCTVPVDIGGWLPQSGLPQFADETKARRWLELIDLRDEAFKKSDIVQEAEYLQKILTITPNDPGMLFNYGKILWMLGKHKTSYQELVKAKDLDIRPIRALSSFNKVIRSNVDENNGVYLADLKNLVKEKYIQGEAKGIFLDYCHLTETGNKLVAQWLLPVMDKVVKSPQLDVTLLSGLIRTDSRAETKNDFVRGHELYAQALTFENNGRPDLAEKYYIQALAYLPEFISIITNLGNIYFDQGDFKRAIEMYNNALKINPKNHQAFISLGYLSLKKNRLDEAEDFFVNALKVTPNLSKAYAGLGDIAMRRGEFQQAIKYYNDSLRLGLDNAWLRNNLANAYLSLGDEENAVKSWDEALKFNPFDKGLKVQIEKYSK